jgi:hypothetical protein
MNSPSERLNEQLEQQLGNVQTHPISSSPSIGERDAEVDRLVVLAQRLRSAPFLQPDPDFAQQLEERLLLRARVLHATRTARDRSWRFLPSLRPILAPALSLVIVLLVVGSGVLIAGAQATNPDNPLYEVKHWEQHVQMALSSSPESRAELSLQFVQDHLTALTHLANPADAQAYRQELQALEQEMEAAMSTITTLPPGIQRDRLFSELTTLKERTFHTLYGLLPHLALPERLATTTTLAHLGASVPVLQRVTLTLPTQARGQAIISILGTGIQPGVLLVIDGQATTIQGSEQNGTFIFIISPAGSPHYQEIGILNPDGTAVQTAAIIVTNPGKNETGNSTAGASKNNNTHNNANNNHTNKNNNGNGHSKSKEIPHHFAMRISDI